MTRTALLPALALLLLAAPAVAASSGSGGALAQPLRQGTGGGGVAPERPGAPSDARSGDEAASPLAESAQEPMPSAPEREQQPSEEAPSEAQPAPYELAPAAPEEALPAAREPGVAPAAEQPAAEAGAGGFLPWTGLEVAAVAAIGLALLLGGMALRPRRRVPAGRARR